MSFYVPPWDSNLEPSDGNVRQWLDNLYSKFQPVEQSRWNQSNIDTLFYAGEQRFINAHFNFYPQYNWQNFHFNIIQQPINMVTGYQRQHRKSIQYIPCEGADTKTTDQYTKVVMHANNQKGILEKFSKGCELATISGMVLAQPYLDYRDDPINGTLDLKIWEYNSFLIDPYFREPDASDANFVWTQQYISKQEAESMFPDKMQNIRPMNGTPQRYGSFYFLPENYNMARNDLLVLSYVWYKWKKKKKKLINRRTNEVFDFGGKEEELGELTEAIPELEVIEIDVPCWKLAVILNDQLMYQGENPLQFEGCPFIPIYWNYDPHMANADLRVRSLTRSCRDSQYLFNRRIILNHDISESSINSGWKYKEDSIANPENLRYAGQGKDLIIKSGFEMTDIEKIIPSAVPPSDLQLADQLLDLIFRTTGVNQELMGMAQDDKAGITEILRQGAGLVTLQKYFDQWDTSLRLLGERILGIVQNNWSPAKVSRMIGEEVTPFFFSKVFSKTHIIVAEGVNTTVQQQEQFLQMLKLNELLGGIVPPRFILQHSTIQGKQELIEAIEQQQQQQMEMQNHTQMLTDAALDAKLKETYSRAAANIAMARERHGRSEANIGLFEERLSEITQNRAMATKTKVESLEKLLEVIHKYGEIEAAMKANDLQTLNTIQEGEEDREKLDAKQTSLSNDFLSSIMNPNQSGEQQPPQEQSQLTGVTQ